MAMFDAVVIAATLRQAAAAEAVAQAGGRVAATLDWHAAPGLAAHVGAAPVLAIEAEGAAAATLDAVLPAVAALIERDGLHAVVTLDHDQIDQVAGALLSLPGVELLCRPGYAQQVAALAVAGRLAAGTGLSDRVREDDGDRQHAITEEIARLAAIIVDFADRERDVPGGHVGDRHQSFGFQPAVAAVDPATIRQALRARRLRDSFFRAGLFEDPAWDMLLDLYAAHLEGVQVSVSSLCIAAAVPPTTALRWMSRLTAARLLERRPDPSDGRRVFIALSPRGLAGMAGYAAALSRAGLPFA